MPVSFVTLVFILVLFASFLLVVRKSYRPAAAAPENEVADNLPAELAWRATPESRRAALQELRNREAAELSSYAWIDRDSGVVQLPIERAMELTVQQYRGRR